MQTNADKFVCIAYNSPMQSNNASKKTRKIANDPATGATEISSASDMTASSRTSRASKAKKTEITDMGSARHRKSNPVEIVDATPARSIAASAATNGAYMTISEPSTEDIARLAYSFWEARGFKHGSAEEDWLKAEQELLAKH